MDGAEDRAGRGVMRCDFGVFRRIAGTVVDARDVGAGSTFVKIGFVSASGSSFAPEALALGDVSIFVCGFVSDVVTTAATGRTSGRINVCARDFARNMAPTPRSPITAAPQIQVCFRIGSPR